MARREKFALALGVTVALHVGVLLLAVPRLSGLTATGETTDAGMSDVETTVAVSDPKPSENEESPAPLTPATVETPKPLPEKIEIAASEPPAAVAPAAKLLIPAPEPTPKASPPPVVKTPAKPEPKPAIKPSAKSEPKTTGKAAAAPSGGKTATVIPANSSYANQVRQHLARFAGALPPGANGEARVQFVVQLDGRVSDVHLVKQSGNAGLDAVALNLPRQAQPLPLPGKSPQRLEVPVQAMAATP
ncbi:MAG: TonB family protein [Stagnimonas sp.]|nr:TonB family protein [Stagnimonas sp.]